MEDRMIVDLYWARDEQAIAQTDNRYGGYCRTIAQNIVGNTADAAECVNDTYMDAWNSIPPHRPARLGTFLGKITRRIAIDRVRRDTAQKRGGGQLPLVLEELSACVPDHRTLDEEIDRRALQEALNAFVTALPKTEQRVFLRRYWYMESIEVIADDSGFSQSKVKSMLARTRRKLRDHLTERRFLP